MEEELTRLLVHGLLHLAGFDHRTAAELDVMERETERFIRLSAASRRRGATLRDGLLDSPGRLFFRKEQERHSCNLPKSLNSP